jgi:uncharacterized protein (DUF2141 family)
MPGWVRSLAILGAALPSIGASPLASLDLGVSGLRSEKGMVRACVTADRAHFPACDKDPQARHLSVPATAAAALRFDGLPSGAYAVALFHDENGNGRIDTRFGIPTEGVGFSNNPRLMFGPPSFAAASIALTDRPVDQTVKLKYFL